MIKTENDRYKVLSLALILAIAGIIIFVIIPKYSPLTPDKIVEKIDFSNSAWVEQYMEKTVGFYGKDFFIGSAFSYNIRSNKMIVTYASQGSIEEARAYYLTLPGAELIGRNDVTSLNISAEPDGQELQVYNYYSEVSRVFELELTLEPDNAEIVIGQLEKAFPVEEIEKIRELEALVSGEVFGGYVRYRYDEFDKYALPFVPIFSRAFFYDGTQEDFNRIVNVLNEAYPDNSYDETQKMNYYKINEQIISVSYLITDSNESIVSISIQKDKIGD